MGCRGIDPERLRSMKKEKIRVGKSIREDE